MVEKMIMLVRLFRRGGKYSTHASQVMMQRLLRAAAFVDLCAGPKLKAPSRNLTLGNTLALQPVTPFPIK